MLNCVTAVNPFSQNCLATNRELPEREVLESHTCNHLQLKVQVSIFCPFGKRMATHHFHQMIWQLVYNIPFGRVATYGQIATLCGQPNQARAVGRALSCLPEDTRIPWFRVINAQGRISFPDGSERYRKQQKLLESEGILPIKGKIKLSIYQWDPVTAQHR